MRDKKIHKAITYFIAAIWIGNGLFCKVLNFVPRHEQIVSRILGGEYSGLLTRTIGVAETIMAIWILTGIKIRLNVVMQIMVVAIMNILEFILVPDLLLFGKFNAIFALLFIFVIYFNGFVLNKKITQNA